jgi:hypothetical protein
MLIKSSLLTKNGKTKTCVLCGDAAEGLRYPASPLAAKGVCCQICLDTKVLVTLDKMRLSFGRTEIAHVYNFKSETQNA